MLGGIFALLLIDFWLIKRAAHQLYDPVYIRLVTGSRPLEEDQYPRMKVVDRKTVLEEIKSHYFPATVNPEVRICFGVIIGPVNCMQ